jgi:hypothetical protein
MRIHFKPPPPPYLLNMAVHATSKKPITVFMYTNGKCWKCFGLCTPLYSYHIAVQTLFLQWGFHCRPITRATLLTDIDTLQFNYWFQSSLVLRHFVFVVRLFSISTVVNAMALQSYILTLLLFSRDWLILHFVLCAEFCLYSASVLLRCKAK